MCSIFLLLCPQLEADCLLLSVHFLPCVLTVVIASLILSFADVQNEKRERVKSNFCARRRVHQLSILKEVNAVERGQSKDREGGKEGREAEGGKVAKGRKKKGLAEKAG